MGGPPLRCICGITRAMDACARTTTSTSFIKRSRDAVRRLSCRAVSPANTASNAPSARAGTISIVRRSRSAVSWINAIVGSSVVRRVAATPIRRPDFTAASAMLSSIRRTGKSNWLLATAMAGPTDEQVTITASAPPWRADSIMCSNLRIVSLVSPPLAIVLRISDSSSM